MVGDYFASCSHDQTAKLWCTERTYPLRSFVGHTYDVDVGLYTLALLFSILNCFK